MQRVKMEDWICRSEGIEKLTRLNLYKIQLEKLNDMLVKLKNRGGIYKDIPQKLNSLEELKNLPFTYPEMLREQPQRFLNCSQSQVSRVISQQSSGTSGGAKRVFYSENDLKNTVDFFASGISEMLSEGEKCLIAFPFSGPSGLGDLIAKAVEKLGAIPIKTGFGLSYGELIKLIREEKPETYIGFPVPILSVLRLYDGNFPIKRALISGDACPQAVWNGLSERLRLYPHYGSREMALGGAVTCPAFEGMHLRENHIIAEIIDKDGNVMPDGSWGELVITTIGLEAMPLLRYRTGDLSRIIPEKCPCGGVTKRIQKVIRQESGKISIENLDGELFLNPDLIDYKASFDGKLHIDARLRDKKLSVNCRNLCESAKRIYPDVEIQVNVRTAGKEDLPAYSGKRYILTDIGE